MRTKKIIISILCVLTLAIAISAGISTNTMATENTQDNTISKGIFIAGIDVSGMTKKEAASQIEDYIKELSSKTITLNAGTDEIKATALDMGLEWTNKDVIDEALEYGKTGNIIQRYKALKDLEKESKEYDVKLSFDKSSISNLVTEKCSVFDIEPTDATIKKTAQGFDITEGKTGIGVDVKKSADMVFDYMNESWDREDAVIDLSVEVVEPKVTAEALKNVKDLIGTFKTSYTTSSTARCANIENGARLINGTVLMPGETFSAIETITPFTSENGYYLAGSYLMGKVVDSFGGGICQVSTTLYNAVLKAELGIVERYNHSMIVGYVDPSADAAIAESSGKDFKFKNDTEYPVYIEGITSNKTITFNIYGKETRPSNRKVEYVSETIETIDPVGKKYSLDGGTLFGQQRQTQSAHTGYKAKLWKHVYVDGKETEVTQVNSSTYKAEPAYVIVGTAWGDEASVAALAAAVATGDQATVDATIAELAPVVNQAAALAAQAEAQAAAQAAQAAAAAAAGQ